MLASCFWNPSTPMDPWTPPAGGATPAAGPSYGLDTGVRLLFCAEISDASCTCLSNLSPPGAAGAGAPAMGAAAGGATAGAAGDGVGGAGIGAPLYANGSTPAAGLVRSRWYWSPKIPPSTLSASIPPVVFSSLPIRVASPPRDMTGATADPA